MGVPLPPAVVLLSGGLDSATTAALARHEGYALNCLTIDYGQRHRAELDAAARVAKSLGAVAHRVLRIDLSVFGGSALTDASIAVPETPSAGIPVTYVPARNTIFLSLALAWAEVLGAGVIYIGANAVDYSGYPDCRPDYLDAFETMANLATRSGIEGHRLWVRAPLVLWPKERIIREGLALGVDFGLTVSCYQANGVGLACGRCDACRIRRAGFERAGVPDITRYTA
jgi:7-cyano-7-deazaguanine synthase